MSFPGGFVSAPISGCACPQRRVPGRSRARITEQTRTHNISTGVVAVYTHCYSAQDDVGAELKEKEEEKDKGTDRKKSGEKRIREKEKKQRWETAWKTQIDMFASHFAIDISL